MELRMKITVCGLPAPQGSKRHIGNGRMIESSKKVAPWREAVVWALRNEMGTDGWVKIMNPVLLLITFSLPRPKSAPKRVTRPAKYPDLSKLIRSTEDAITTAGVWGDDALVTDVHARKVFAGSPEGLDVSGAVIEIWELDT